MRKTQFLYYPFLRMNPFEVLSKVYYSTPLGGGSGKGGGAGGSIRESGGKLGEMGAAKEEEYFSKKNRELLEDLKDRIKEDLEHYKKTVEKLTKAMEEARKKLDSLKDRELHGKEAIMEKFLKDQIQRLRAAIDRAMQMMKELENQGSSKRK